MNKFLFCSFYYKANLKTGANKRFENIISSLVNHLSKNQKIIVLIKKGNRSECFLNDKIEIHEIPDFALLDRFFSFIFFSIRLSSYDPMIVVSDFMPIPLRALSKHFHFQLVHDVRNFTQFKRTDYFSFGSFFQKSQWGKCQNIITVSNFTKNELMHYCKIDSEKIFVSPNGIDQSYLNSVPTSKPDIDILYIATFEKRKNHQLLVKSLANYNDERSIRVCFIGKNLGNKQEVRKLAALLGNKVTVDFIDNINTEKELIDFYDRSNLFISPSLYEGFGMPIIEALARGCKVLCSDIEVFREIGGNHVEYFPVDDHNGLLSLIVKNIDNTNRLPISSDFIESYKWSNISRNLIEFFNKLDLSDL